MINNVTLTGRLTKDPALRATGTGKSVANFTLAVDRTYKDASGEYGADFINCVAWGQTAEIIQEYLNKGSLIGVEGRIQTRQYENNEGNTVFVTEIVVSNVTFLESKKQAQANQQQTQQNYSQPAKPAATQQNTYAQGYPQGARGSGASKPQTSNNNNPFENTNFDGDPFGTADGATDIDDDDLPF